MWIDIISVPWLIFFRHRGLRVRYVDGTCHVYVCSPRGGVVRQTLVAFADGYRVDTSPANTAFTPSQVVARAESVLGRPYDAMRWNCEHFVAFALGNKIESQQVQVATVGAFALILIRLARKA